MYPVMDGFGPGFCFFTGFALTFFFSSEDPSAVAAAAADAASLDFLLPALVDPLPLLLEPPPDSVLEREGAGEGERLVAAAPLLFLLVSSLDEDLDESFFEEEESFFDEDLASLAFFADLPDER